MEIKYFCTMWGMEQAKIDDALNLIMHAGFDGIEMALPDSSTCMERLKSSLHETGLDLITQVRTEGSNPEEQIASLEKEVLKAKPLNPLLINIHSGKDFWTIDDNMKVIHHAEKLAKELGIKILHETHRARATFCTTSTMAIIDAIPEIRFTADFSHWCCVHNTLLQDQTNFIDRVIERSDYIHSRVGSATTPQITDPRAPEWAKTVEIHVNWWKKIVNHHKNKSSAFLPICSEFGPPEYMVTIPYTGQPIANAWEINCHMKDMLKKRLG
ncbi:MAG: sugar phosphate isomerase/epimerase family protein [Candidatus Anammoxibacter sp.]